MGRLEFLQVSSVGGLSEEKPSGAVAAVVPLGESRFTLGTGAGWDDFLRIGTAQLSGSYTAAGDPIGFMEGLFGPSISVGVSTRYQYADSTGESFFDVDAGFQFSLFPSSALGMTYTDIIEDRLFAMGFSHVFNRNLKAHASLCEGDWQVGCELQITRVLRLFSGADGEAVNAGLSFSPGEWDYGYGAVLHEGSVEHRLGVSRRFP
ncbi:MAG: hypothetical protein KAH54_02000 [Candidatus Sabulitectum sp.]|nr:hypothetical protein [Candidatus Sabulitectum sp.]